MSNPEIADIFAGTIRRHGMLQQGDIVLVGLSGGPDSVCLLHLLHRIQAQFGLQLHAVYVNHNLRPEEIPAEISFCEKTCRELGVNFILKSVDVASHQKQQGLNRQEAGRELRYMAFEEAAAGIGASKIALAHNADDQAETIFMRLIRGSGPKGLGGIPPKRGRIIRPLIETERGLIEQFLENENIPFVLDSSNLKQDYLRNRFRLSLMPELKKINPNLLHTLRTTASILQEEERYLEIIVTKTLMKLISRKSAHRIELFLSPLERLETVILRRVLRRAIDGTEGLRSIGFQNIEDIMNLLKNGSPGDRIYLPKGLRVIREYALLVITSEEPVRIADYLLRPGDEVAIVGAGVVIKASLEDRPDVSEKAEDLGDGKSSVLLDAGKMLFPLTIRARRCGDLFYPHGFGKRKKLQDYLVDEKVPRDEREQIPILLSGSDIIWVAGYRSDERFRPTADTKKYLRLVIVKGKF
ncbi:MAG: tRNA lysidine(34) synthetase TilS [Thermodesulfovibrio sp.]|nr:tRNA lysidine(34) synthetase TilS [Thermodesulfovibrio sp.]